VGSGREGTSWLHVVRHELEASLRSALGELQPADLMRPHLPTEPPALILAVGKAALPMLRGALEVFPEAPWIATPPLEKVGDLGEQGAYGGAGMVAAGAHPLPDTHSVAAAELVLQRVATLGPSDTLLLLVSGGGSALWCAPWGVSLAEKRLVVDQ